MSPVPGCAAMFLLALLVAATSGATISLAPGATRVYRLPASTNKNVVVGTTLNLQGFTDVEAYAMMDHPVLGTRYSLVEGSSYLVANGASGLTTEWYFVFHNLNATASATVDLVVVPVIATEVTPGQPGSSVPTYTVSVNAATPVLLYAVPNSTRSSNSVLRVTVTDLGQPALTRIFGSWRDISTAPSSVIDLTGADSNDPHYVVGGPGYGYYLLLDNSDGAHANVKLSIDFIDRAMGPACTQPSTWYSNPAVSPISNPGILVSVLPNLPRSTGLLQVSATVPPDQAELNWIPSNGRPDIDFAGSSATQLTDAGLLFVFADGSTDSETWYFAADGTVPGNASAKLNVTITAQPRITIPLTTGGRSVVTATPPQAGLFAARPPASTPLAGPYGLLTLNLTAGAATNIFKKFAFSAATILDPRTSPTAGLGLAGAPLYYFSGGAVGDVWYLSYDAGSAGADPISFIVGADFYPTLVLSSTTTATSFSLNALQPDQLFTLSTQTSALYLTLTGPNSLDWTVRFFDTRDPASVAINPWDVSAPSVSGSGPVTDEAILCPDCQTNTDYIVYIIVSLGGGGSPSGTVKAVPIDAELVTVAPQSPNNFYNVSSVQLAAGEARLFVVPAVADAGAVVLLQAQEAGGASVPIGPGAADVGALASAWLPGGSFSTGFSTSHTQYLQDDYFLLPRDSGDVFVLVWNKGTGGTTVFFQASLVDSHVISANSGTSSLIAGPTAGPMWSVVRRDHAETYGLVSDFDWSTSNSSLVSLWAWADVVPDVLSGSASLPVGLSWLVASATGTPDSQLASKIDEISWYYVIRVAQLVDAGSVRWTVLASSPPANSDFCTSGSPITGTCNEGTCDGPGLRGDCVCTAGADLVDSTWCGCSDTMTCNGRGACAGNRVCPAVADSPAAFEECVAIQTASLGPCLCSDPAWGGQYCNLPLNGSDPLNFPCVVLPLPPVNITNPNGTAPCEELGTCSNDDDTNLIRPILAAVLGGIAVCVMITCCVFCLFGMIQFCRAFGKKADQRE